jgi:hypothetical protein
MRIDKLHEYESSKTWLDGSGVTVCIIDDKLGAHTNLTKFHKSLYHSGKNNLYGDDNRQYIDLKYFESDGDGNFSEQWENDTDTKQEKWNEIYDENDGNYTLDKDVHGTYCLAAMRQIAPAATYIFIATDDNEQTAQNAIKWLSDDRDDPDFDNKAPYDYFDISLVSMSWSNEYHTDFSTELETLANNSVIPVAAVGQFSNPYNSSLGSIFLNTMVNKFPCYSDDVIGVTGVLDTDSSSSNARWYRDERANSGYGVDIASIFAGTQLGWQPVPNYGEFIGTSNSCPLVAGTLALLKQYRNNHKSGTTFDISFVRTLFEKTGDAPGSAPSSNTTEIGGYLDWINDDYNATYYEFFPYHSNANYSTYDLGWGIIDGYEMYKYFSQNY